MDDEQSHKLLIRNTLVLIFVVLQVAACARGGAHADLLLNIRNDSAQSATVRWTSTGFLGAKSEAFLDAGAETLQGLVAGTYTLSVDGGPSPVNLVVVPSSGDPASAVVVIGQDLSLALQ